MYGAAPSRARRWLPWLAVLAIVVAAVLVTRGVDRRHDTKLAGPVPAPTGSAIPHVESPTPASTWASPVAAPSPPAVTLVPFEGTQLPVSTSAGPTSVNEDTASGFAPTPEGAAFAALHLSIRAVPDVGPSVFTPTIEHQVAGDASTYLSDVEAAYAAAVTRAGVAAGQPIQPATAVATGWKLTGFGLTEPVTVHVLLGSTGSPLLIDVPVTVIHTAGDWKLLPPPDGELHRLTRRLRGRLHAVFALTLSPTP